MPRRWVSCSRGRASRAYPPRKLLAEAAGAFDRTDPNDSVSVTGPGVYPPTHSNSMRSRRDPRAIHPTGWPCKRTSSRSAIRAALVVGWHLGIKSDAERDAERLQRAQQPGDVERAPPGLQAIEIKPVICVRLREILLRDAPRLAYGADRITDVARLAYFDRLAGHDHHP